MLLYREPKGLFILKINKKQQDYNNLNKNKKHVQIFKIN